MIQQTNFRKNIPGFLLLLLASILLTYANSAMATNYECNTAQALQWDKGRIINDNNRFSWEHAVIHFNDETGDLWIAINKNPDSLYNPLPFKILNKMNPDQELFAVYDETQKVHTPADKSLASSSEGSSFRLRGWDKETGMIFLFFSTAVNEISTGKCQVYNEEIPEINRE